MKLSLRKTLEQDLDHFFEFQKDDKANYLAAFTAKDPYDRAAYFEKWTKIIVRSDVNMQTILLDDTVIGSVARFEIDGNYEISYWLDRQCWGKGMGTQSLQMFLNIEKIRPLRARVAFDNIGSQKVIEKCGFLRVGTDRGFANARNKEIEEFVYKLS